jgi:hypothetical protein
MEPLTLIALISGVGSLVVSFLTHIRFSKCYGMERKTPLMTPDPKYEFPINDRPKPRRETEYKA